MDISKLPKWAQRHIRILERDLKNAREQLTALNDEHANTGLTLERGVTWAAPLNLPNGLFRISTGESRSDYVELYRDTHGNIRLRAGKILAIYPRAANVAYVKNEEGP